ncbi:T9SS type B sorting domain-containing protein, partial (plasmid) [Pedobacter sp. BS3]|uniref:T9SS type B sorting domain-containing protein n=1 Tax=Pedobacter sp. BS3 TaxID=2567937 RepID=UPI0011F02B68
MKRYLLLCSVFLSGVWGVKAQTVYFSQDFNSSTDYTTYIGSGTNQFDGLMFNGTNSINTLNNKLQIIKNGGTGTNRASVTKTDHPFNPGGTGGFLKVSMEITVSNNTTNISNGFRFSIGANMSGTAPAAPADGNVHSDLYVNPTATPGAFILAGGAGAGGAVKSSAFSGTQKIVWYINNTGVPVGYNAPDGTQASVLNDYADIWAIDESGKAVLAIDDAPATTPTLAGLQQLKISNNPNFVATLDIDDIVISEEPTIELKTITSVADVSPVTAPVKTIFSLLPLPAQIGVTYEDGTTGVATVRWSAVTTYNPYKLGEYTVLGAIVPGSGAINLNNLSVITTVTLRDNINIVNTFSPNGDGKNDTWIIPDLQRYVHPTVEVYARDGKRLFYSTDPNVGWDGRNQSG